MQKHKKYLALMAIFAVLFASILGWSLMQQQQARENENSYKKAIEMIECGAYEEALEAFRALGYYKESISYFLEAKAKLDKANNDYEYAIELFKDYQYQEAIEIFSRLGNFKDCKEKLDTIREFQYTTAIELFDAKNYEQSYKIFSSLGNFRNCTKMAELSRERMSEAETQEMNYQIAYREYGARNYRSALSLFNQLQDYKDSISMAKKCQKEIYQNYQTIAGGVQHSVAIQNTGKIICTGNNDYGQCDISGWENEDIVSIDCGGVMTIGLKDNGKVLVSTNYRSIKVAEWEKWENIVAVSAGYSYVIGLKEDGTVVGTGHDAGDGQLDVNDWKNVIAVATGWRHTVGLTADGAVYITGFRSASQLRQIANHKEDWSNIIAIAAGGGHNGSKDGNGHTVGLKSDGTVVAVGDNTFGQCNVDEWTDIVAIAAGDSHTVGLRSDGTVLITKKYESNVKLGDEWTDIVAIAAGTEFTLGLKSNGTVLAEGYNYQKQIPEPDTWDNVLIYSDWTSVTGLDIADEHE